MKSVSAYSGYMKRTGKNIQKRVLVTNEVNKGDSSICIRLMLSNDYESNLAIMSFDQFQSIKINYIS